MILVDTGAWYAIFVASDARHQRTTEWFRSNTTQLITTDFIVDETLTLLRSRGENSRAIEFGRQLVDLEAVPVHHVDEDDFVQAWRLFKRQPNRKWSFTDCTSFAVAKNKHIKKILTFDHHFRQFGIAEVLL